MAKLIDLFNEREPELYNYVKYPYKEDDDTQPYRYTTLDNAEPMDNTFFEDQSNPVSLSARRDFNRMFQFSKSAQGLVFLGKQTFLQTGNTFAQTRLYNPLNVQIHSVPFVHMSRHVDVKQTVESLFGGTSDPERYARLQNETSDAAKVRGISRAEGKGGILNINNQPNVVSLGGIGKRIVDQFTTTFRQATSGFSAQFENPTGNRPEANIEKLIATHYNRLTNKFKTTGIHLWSQEDQYYKDGNKLQLLDNWKDNIPLIVPTLNGQSLRIGLANRYVRDFDYSPPSVQVGNEIISYQTELEEWEDKNEKYAKEVNNYLASTRGNGKNIPFLGTGSFSGGTFNARTRYYKDPIQAGSIISDPASPTDVDSIDVIFSVKDSEPVRFRAFLEDLSETVTPTYNENKYIGRYETFYTYNKVIRDVSFKLTLNAFSEQELHHIHRKMSYLTSLAYPEVTNNYLTPNIFKITIGKIFTKQPCILQSLSHNIETDFSWDINEQLPMAFTSNIGIRLLDKNLHRVTDQSIYSVG